MTMFTFWVFDSKYSFWANLVPKLKIFCLALKRLRGQFDPSRRFFQKCTSKERVNPWFFVTFNIITSYIFPENFI